MTDDTDLPENLHPHHHPRLHQATTPPPVDLDTEQSPAQYGQK